MTIDEKTWNELEDYREGRPLEHHGVKGMRWGVRKDRKSSATKRQSGKSTSSKPSKKSKRAKEKLAKAEKKAQKAAAKKEAKRQKILSNPRDLYKHRNEFTYDEIKKAMERFDWEKRLNSYTLERDKQFKERLNIGAEYVNIMFKYTNNAINLYNSAARMINTFQGEDKLKYIKPPPKNDGDNKDDKDDKDNKDKKDKK